MSIQHSLNTTTNTNTNTNINTNTTTNINTTKNTTKNTNTNTNININNKHIRPYGRMRHNNEFRNEILSMTIPVPLPNIDTLKYSTKLSIELLKAISYIFYNDSYFNKIKIIYQNHQQIIYKHHNKYSSPIQKIDKIHNEYIVTTENTIYILSCNIDVSNPV